MATAVGAPLPKLVERRSNGIQNKLAPEDRRVHDWYRFVLSFPPHLVRNYIERWNIRSNEIVLDPFCGTGTTLVECKKRRILSIGIEANPIGYLASRTKTRWFIDARKARNLSREVASEAASLISQAKEERRSLSPERFKLLLTNSISAIPLHKTLCLLEIINREADDEWRELAKLAVAKILVSSVGNLRFGPEVGLGEVKQDAPVESLWLESMEAMCDDLEHVQDSALVSSTVFAGDARLDVQKLPRKSIAAVITSPPYPNEKDYTRTTRLESVVLGLINSKEELRAIKKGLVRSNTRSVYKSDSDDSTIASFGSVNAVAEEIESRRIRLGKTSGFERLYARVTKLYFGGMARHLLSMKGALRPGARLAYVVGDQASYLQVMIRTGQILAEIAEAIGYRVDAIDLFRTRFATATRQELREEVVLLTWPGK